MAVLTPRLVLVCAVPAVVTFLTIFWTRRRRNTLTTSKISRENQQSTLPHDTLQQSQDLCSSRSYNPLQVNQKVFADTLPKVEDNQITTAQNLCDDILSNQQVYECEESTLSVEAEVQKSFISDCESAVQHRDCLVQDALNQPSNSDNQNSKIVVESEKQHTLSVEHIDIVQDLLPKMHVKSDEKQLSTKLEQDCHLSPQSGSTSDLSERQNSPVNSEASYSDVQDETKPRRSRGSCRVSEESRDSAMGAEEDAILSDEPECAVLESDSTVSLCENRTEYKQELLLQKLPQPLNGDSGCFNDLDVLESPPPSIYSDGHSEGSCDSGKGGSDIQVISNCELTQISENAVLVYEFELASELCGRLIGRHGKHVNFIKTSTNANVFIKRHPFNARLKLCAIQGTKTEIKSSLELIRKRFPLSQYPALSLAQVNLPLSCGVMVPETLQLHLPEGVTCDVILSSMVSAGHFFVQQPTHPTYPSLNRLDTCMTSCYSQMDTPQLPQPVEVGVICACPVLEGWFRAQVVNLYENSDECDVKFVDYGGYSCVPITRLRQIRSDFMTLPFQASECYLANVKPATEAWSLEACATFEELAQGQILQSLVVGHAEDGTPYVHLYRVQGVSTVFINRELVSRGVAQWVESEM